MNHSAILASRVCTVAFLAGFVGLASCGSSEPAASPSASSGGSGGSATMMGTAGTSSTGGAIDPGTGGAAGGVGAADAAPNSDDGGAAMVTGDGGLPPDFGKGESNSGPGGPSKTYTAAQLFKQCAALDGGPEDVKDQHDNVTMYDGYLLMPWAPETGGGGVNFFDISDPCAPKQVGYGYSAEMRESHTTAISNRAGGKWLALDMMRTTTVNAMRPGGVQIWDISDIKAPKAVAALDVPGHNYPDAYKRVTLTEFWQGKYIYSGAGLNGVFVYDMTDPTKPKLAKQIDIQPAMPVFGTLVVGNLLFVHAGEGSRVVMFDISDPLAPQPIAGGDFNITDDKKVNTNAYMTNLSGGFAYFARQSGAGGLIIYDIHNPATPKYAGGFLDNGLPGGNGGYVFAKDTFAFVGNSGFGGVYDITDYANVKLVSHTQMQGDNDWVTPIGNVVFMAVDENAVTNQATLIEPWTEKPDTTPPKATWSYPADGSKNLALTSRIGVTFSDAIDTKSAWKSGHVMLYETAIGWSSRVAAEINVADTIVNVSPVAPLKPNTSYTLEIPAGGLEDFNGNKLQTGYKVTVSTGAG